MKRMVQTISLTTSVAFILYFALSRASTAQGDQKDQVSDAAPELSSVPEAGPADDPMPPAPEPENVQPEY